MNKKYYRHGDVNLIPIGTLPKGAKLIKKVKEYTVALGEVTGHHHTIYPTKNDKNTPIEVWEYGGAEFLVISEPKEFRHQEHEIEIIDPNVYRTPMEIEENPFTKTIEQVRD